MGKYAVIFISLISILIISALGALSYGLFWGLTISNYIASFCIIAALQLFIGGLWNYRIDRYARLELKKINAATAMADAVQHIEIVCAYCGTTNLVKILVGEENTFNCDACKQANAVFITTSSARITQPIMPKEELATIFKNIDE